ncbi:peptidyl-tRNA hydrolase [Candidatus Hydrogenisulfobacillus filiaventi]|uniref:Peptidyl-tRNA hydrolase n=1 Tax=Candidatus Hydrogenisulfobacillus filiaventi TaxID=2707344 RepID=A0A6F8ZKC3_9FIRM|nr:peptidyl-tRNA hydrolase [Candidatus Hydrogenisulfobacillus filiaventi]
MSGPGPAPIRLVVGLGNPGPQYRLTRHNLGFRVLDRLAERQGLVFRLTRRGEEAEWAVPGNGRVLLLKPHTFMNLSGQAVGPLVRRHGWPPAAVLVVVDDLALAPGQIRLRAGGSAGGHNGLKSLIEALGTEEFPRLRIGIGHPQGRMPVIDWVLGVPWGEDRARLEAAVDTAAEAVETVLTRGWDQAATRYNATSLLPGGGRAGGGDGGGV